jgi:hypothetical protein
MQVTVTNSTEEDLELHISWPGCSASKQASKSTPWAHQKEKKKKRNKETIQDQNTKAITISLNLCKQKLASS